LSFAYDVSVYGKSPPISWSWSRVHSHGNAPHVDPSFEYAGVHFGTNVGRDSGNRLPDAVRPHPPPQKWPGFHTGPGGTNPDRRLRPLLVCVSRCVARVTAAMELRRGHGNRWRRSEHSNAPTTRFHAECCGWQGPTLQVLALLAIRRRLCRRRMVLLLNAWSRLHSLLAPSRRNENRC